MMPTVPNVLEELLVSLTEEGEILLCCNNKDFLGMSDKDIFEYAQLLHVRGGNLRSIADPPGPPAACKYYANQAPGVKSS